MRRVYRVLAYLIAAEVLVQAAALAYGFAGLGHWLDKGGRLDHAALEAAMDGKRRPFPEAVGLVAHGVNGSLVVPALAVLLVVASFFAALRGATKWAALVFVLVTVQAELGFAAGVLPALGALHGLNALLLFAAAWYAARRARAAGNPSARAEDVPPARTSAPA